MKFIVNFGTILKIFTYFIKVKNKSFRQKEKIGIKIFDITISKSFKELLSNPLKTRFLAPYLKSVIFAHLL